MAITRVKELFNELKKTHIVAIDTNVFIYALEGNKDFISCEIFFQYLAKSKKYVVTSVLTILESIVPLYKTGRKERIPFYIDFIHGSGRIDVIEVNQQITLKAAELRAIYKFKTPDSIHLATAIAADAGLFITADRDFRMNKVDDLRIIKI